MFGFGMIFWIPLIRFKFYASQHVQNSNQMLGQIKFLNELKVA